jgi:DNA-binding LacI/PurR family transcriptional regulator
LVLRNEPVGATAETRERILAAAAELGYQPDTRARLLARQRTRLIGLVYDAFNRFHAEGLESLYELAETNGYELAVSATTRTRSETDAVETLMGIRCESLILFSTTSPTRWLNDLGRTVPVVVTGRRLTGKTSVDRVGWSDKRGMKEAISHLTGLGHRDIAHVSGPPDDFTARQRAKGYQAAMRELGMEKLIRVVSGGTEIDGGVVAADELIAGRLPTAVIAHDDVRAAALMDRLAAHGFHVPTDMSVVGYNDSIVASLPHIQLTSVRQDAHEITRLALAWAMERASEDDDNRQPPRSAVLESSLTVRSTTAPPRGR